MNLVGTIDVQSASTLDAYGSGGLLNVQGVISTSAGTGGITIASSNGSGGKVGYSAANSYLGDTSINTGATLQMNIANAIPNGSNHGNVVLNGALDLKSYGTTINGLTGSGTVTSSAAGTPVLTVGSNDQSSTFSGIIQNGSGTVGLNKSGTGTLTITNPSNSYGGGTTVQQGLLKVNNTSGSGTGSGPVVVNSGGALGGGFGLDTTAINAANLHNGVYDANHFGIISGAVEIASGGHLAPGNSVGTLTVGSLTLDPGSILDFEFNATPANDFTFETDLNGLTLNGGLGAGGAFNLYLETVRHAGHVSSAGLQREHRRDQRHWIALGTQSAGRVQLYVQQ